MLVAVYHIAGHSLGPSAVVMESSLVLGDLLIDARIGNLGRSLIWNDRAKGS